MTLFSFNSHTQAKAKIEELESDNKANDSLRRFRALEESYIQATEKIKKLVNEESQRYSELDGKYTEAKATIEGLRNAQTETEELRKGESERFLELDRKYAEAKATIEKLRNADANRKIEEFRKIEELRNAQQDMLNKLLEKIPTPKMFMLEQPPDKERRTANNNKSRLPTNSTANNEKRRLDGKANDCERKRPPLNDQANQRESDCDVGFGDHSNDEDDEVETTQNAPTIAFKTNDPDLNPKWNCIVCGGTIEQRSSTLAVANETEPMLRRVPIMIRKGKSKKTKPNPYYSAVKINSLKDEKRQAEEALKDEKRKAEESENRVIEMQTKNNSLKDEKRQAEEALKDEKRKAEESENRVIEMQTKNNSLKDEKRRAEEALKDEKRKAEESENRVIEMQTKNNSLKDEKRRAEEALKDAKRKRRQAEETLEGEKRKRQQSDDHIKKITKDLNKAKSERRDVKQILSEYRKHLTAATTKAVDAKVLYETKQKNIQLRNGRAKFRCEMEQLRNEALVALSNEKIERSLFSKALAAFHKGQIESDRKWATLLKILEEQNQWLLNGAGGFYRPGGIIMAGYDPLKENLNERIDENGTIVKEQTLSMSEFEIGRPVEIKSVGVDRKALNAHINGSNFRGGKFIEQATAAVYLMTGPEELTLCRNLKYDYVYYGSTLLTREKKVVGTLDGGKLVELRCMLENFYRPYRHDFPTLEDFQSLLAETETEADIDISTVPTRGNIKVLLRGGEWVYTACPLFIPLPEKMVSNVDTPAIVSPNAFATKLLRANIELDFECWYALVCCWAVATARTPYVTINECSFNLGEDEPLHSATDAGEIEEVSSKKRRNEYHIPPPDIIKRSRVQSNMCNQWGFKRFIPTGAADPLNPHTITCVVCGKAINGAVFSPDVSLLEHVPSNKNGKKSTFYKQIKRHMDVHHCKLWCVYSLPRGITEWTTELYTFYQIVYHWKVTSPLTVDKVVNGDVVVEIIKQRIQAAMDSFKKEGHSLHKNLWTGAKMAKGKSKIKGDPREVLTTDRLKAFLNDCKKCASKVEEKLTGYLEHEKFDMLVAPRFKKEKFINDLNLAMSCSKEYKTFCTTIDQILSEQTHQRDLMPTQV